MNRNLQVYNDENENPIAHGRGDVARQNVLGDVTNRHRQQLSGKEGLSRKNGVSNNMNNNVGVPNSMRPVAPRAAGSSVGMRGPSNSSSSNFYTRTADQVTDIDFGDELDPQACKEYVEDIFEALLANEDRYQPSNGYMAHQPDINEKMRTILFDWLVDVHLKFKLLPETLYLTFNYIDRFLENKAVSRQRLQLVGVTALLIASKYEEIYAPEVRDCVYITDKAYNKQEIYRMERHILATLGFHMTAPNIGSYMKRFVKAAGGDAKFRMLATYFAELTLQEYKMLKYKPSMIVASAISLALRAQKKRAWTPTLEHYTSFSESSLSACIFDMTAIIKKATTATQYVAVRNKFSTSKYMEVARTFVADL